MRLVGKKVMNINSLADKIFRTDVLIIGSEAAGARAAIEAYDQHKELTITVVTKGYLEEVGYFDGWE